MTNNKRDILIIMGRYLPGYKDGGPVRSVKNMVDLLGNEYNFKILTCDRDRGDEIPYPNIKINQWNSVGMADVYYVPPMGFKPKIIVKLAKSVDVVYVCGGFSDYSINTLIANKLGKIKVPVVIAPMGVFAPTALQNKYLKKKIFISIFNTFNMFKNIYWSVSSLIEKKDVLNAVNTSKERIFIAEDLPRKVKTEAIFKTKEKGNIKVVFISRIVPNKNLKQAIQILQQVNCNVDFTLYGPDEDKKYWAECQKELNKLPPNIKWQWKGILDSEQVVETLKEYHICLLPTRGENFGHVIQEALSAGCPCIISDQTPWRNLSENNCGYALPLEDNKPFVNKINMYAEMDEKEFQKAVNCAHKYAIEISNLKSKKTGYREIFNLK